MLTIKKSWKLAALSLAALAVYSCSNDEFEGSLSQGKVSISAGFEQPGAKTRTAVDGSNQVVWLENDAFKLFYTAGGQQKANVFTTSVTNRPTTASFTGEALPSGAQPSYAVYPSADDVTISGTQLTMTLPSTLAGGDASNGPMFADASSGYTSLSFKHLCGLLKLTVTNLPAEAKKFVITADQYIAGTAIASLNEDNPCLQINQGATGNSKSITVTIKEGQQIFYIPIPVGTYNTLTATITQEDGTTPVDTYKPKQWSSVEVKRAQLLYTTFGFQIEVDASTEISSVLNSSLPQTSPAEETKTSVLITSTVDATAGDAKNAEIKIPVVENSNVELNFENVPTATQAAPLKVTDNSSSVGTDVPAETSKNVTTIAIPPVSEEASAPSLEITTPSSTTELAATNQEQGTTFDVVTALTAKNTLVVNNGVKVNKLIIKGGNVRINKSATVSTIEKSEGNSEKTIIYIETGATYPSGLSSEDFELRNADLEEVLQNGGSLTLLSDLVLSEPLVVNSTMTLDLNGHQITATGALNKVLSTKDALILVRRGANLTIKDSQGNGSIDASTVPSIYAAVKLTDANDGNSGSDAALTVEGGTLKGYYYAIVGNGNRHGTSVNVKGGTLVGVNSSAIYHPQEGTLAITNGTLEGLNTAVELRSGTLNISGGSLKSTAETYEEEANGNGTTMSGTALAISQHNTEKDINVTITGGTFEGVYALSEKDLQNNTGNVTLSVTGGTFKGKIQSTHGAEGFIKSGNFDDVTAMNYVADGGQINVTLTKDADVTNDVVILSKGQVTLDMNRKTITNSADIWDTNAGRWSLISVQGGKLTVKGEGQMVGKENDCFAVDVRKGGEVTIENGFFNGNISAVYVLQGGKAYIKGGKFAVQQKDTQYTNGSTFLLNILDEDRGISLIEVTGGTFVGVNPGDNNAEGPHTNFIKAGYHAEYADNSTNEEPVYKVVKDAFEGYTYVLTDEEAEEALVADGSELKIALAADVKVDIKPWQNKPIGTDATSSIVIEGQGHTLTFNNIDSDWNYVTCANAATILTMNNMHLTNSGYNNGPWNRHDIVFNCPVTLNHVTSDKAIGLHKNGALTDVVIEDVHPDNSEVYALWITAEGQTVTMDGCEIKMHSSKSGDRGIKIADQYVDAPALVNLTIKNTKFTTQKKAAVLVTSTAGAHITLDNVDIAGVVADKVNAVWVDSERSAYGEKVTVTGGTKIVEL